MSGWSFRPLRQFLRQGLLDDQIKCLVTFYGVPFRIAPRVANAETKAEIDVLREQLKQVVDNLNLYTSNAEAMAVTIVPDFKMLVPNSPLARSGWRTGDRKSCPSPRLCRPKRSSRRSPTCRMPSKEKRRKNQFLALVNQLRGPIVGLPEMTSTSQPTTAKAASPLTPIQRRFAGRSALRPLFPTSPSRRCRGHQLAAQLCPSCCSRRLAT